MRRIRAQVHGRVQGVAFRASTRRAASALGVSGYARNCADGSVEVLAEGPPEAVERLLGFVRRGPPAARVERLDVSEEPFAGEFDGFSIR
jgi:acylphosphatase